jgi:cytosine/adenosine deaminase-related metal-dependent hydrolase
MEDVVWTKTNTGMNIMKRLEKHGLLREDTLYVHGVHLAKEELEMIKQTKGVMVFNPSSNMNNGVGLPPVMEVVQKGMRWMVGNDGLGFSLARDLQNMVFTSNLKGANTFPLEALRQSILTSYDYASKRLGCKLGRFKKGFEADFLLLDYKQMTPLTKENAFGHFVYGMLDGFVPKEVWVEGEQKVRAYEVVQNDEKKLSEAQKVANRVWEKLKK